jgi:hypothetical protein
VSSLVKGRETLRFNYEFVSANWKIWETIPAFIIGGGGLLLIRFQVGGRQFRTADNSPARVLDTPTEGGGSNHLLCPRVLGTEKEEQKNYRDDLEYNHQRDL